jgi:hypothetical protein
VQALQFAMPRMRIAARATEKHAFATGLERKGHDWLDAHRRVGQSNINKRLRRPHQASS